MTRPFRNRLSNADASHANYTTFIQILGSIFANTLQLEIWELCTHIGYGLSKILSYVSIRETRIIFSGAGKKQSASAFAMAGWDDVAGRFHNELVLVVRCQTHARDVEIVASLEGAANDAVG